MPNHPDESGLKRDPEKDSLSPEEQEEIALFEAIFKSCKLRKDPVELIMRNTRNNLLKSVGNFELAHHPFPRNEGERIETARIIRKAAIDLFFRGLVSEYRIDKLRPIGIEFIRLDQSQKIISDLREGKPLLIRGIHGIGKTAMFLKCMMPGTLKYEDLLIDLRTIFSLPLEKIDLDEFKIFFKRALWREISRHIAQRESEEEKEEERIKSSNMEPLEYLEKYLEDHDSSVSLVVDEAIALRNSPECFEYLLQLKDSLNLKRIHLAIILHYSHKLECQHQELIGEYETHWIRSITLEETTRIIREPLKGKPIKLTDEAVYKIHEITGGRPQEIHRLCQALFFPDPENKPNKLVYEEEDIEKPSPHNKIITDIPELSVPAKELAKAYQMLSLEQQEFMQRLSRDGAVSVSEIADEIVEPLVNLTLVIKEDGRCRINGGLLQKVVEAIVTGKIPLQ